MEASTTSTMETAAAPIQASSNNDGDENPDFDPSLSEEERRFYLRAYPNVDLVRERKVHCTICKMHIGTAPCQEENIRMHPVLRVTHCLKCHDFYNSGEFSKGEDGSELYCRWCGQGGEVYCCASCPYVFCKSCIVKNLSRGVVVDIEQNENWNCFSCAPKILWPLRAQHWALIRYIEKQKKYIESLSYGEAEMKSLMSHDRSTCCRLAKAKCGNMSDSLESLDSSASRRSHGSSGAKKLPKLPASSTQTPPAKRIKTSNDEVVCTPDLLSMLEPDCQITVQQKSRPSPSPATSTPKIISLQTNNSSITIKPHNNTPPPLVLRNTGLPMRHPSPAPVVRRTIIGSRNNTPVTVNHTPVYHTINGYRIDLNSAAQQETFRLPNGKLIQVKRQGTNTQQGGNQSPNHPWMRQPSPITIQHAAAGRPIQIAPASVHATQQYYTVQQQQQHQQNNMHPQIIRYSNTTVTPVGGGQQNGALRGHTQIQVINGVPIAPTANHTAQTNSAASNLGTTVRTPVMVRHIFPDTAIGQARAQLQDQVFNAMEICQHLTGKVQTLTNSNAYKQARNYLEVKELYIHLSYLLTYAIGRFKGLQDKCLGDMRQLGFVNDADSLENGQLAADKQASDDEDNEIEIVEPKTDTITLDSDNEDEETSKQNTVPNRPPPLLNRPQTLTITPAKTASTTVSGVGEKGNSNSHELLSPKIADILTPKITLTTSTPTMPGLTNLSQSGNTRGITVNKPNDKMEEVDMMTAARTFLVSLLEVDSDHADDSSSQQKGKQPRKKTTNKPNPTLLKQKEILERERLEEMKRSDQKLKMKCAISLKKAEEEFPFAKDMLENVTKTDKVKEGVEEMETERETDPDTEKTGEETENCSTKRTKTDTDNADNNESDELEILTVNVDLESSADDVKESEEVMLVEADQSTEKSETETEDNSKKFTIVMAEDDDDDDDENNDNDKGKSLIIEVKSKKNNDKKEQHDVNDAVNENEKKIESDGETCMKDKVETVSECAKRVIESVQASEKKKEMEKKEQPSNKVTLLEAVPPPTSPASTAQNADDNVAIATDNVAADDNIVSADADDTIEPIMIEETDVTDSLESPSKVGSQPKEGDKDTETKEAKSAVISISNAANNEENENIDVAHAATESATVTDFNEPEIDVEKEIEKLLSKVPEETTEVETIVKMMDSGDTIVLKTISNPSQKSSHHTPEASTSNTANTTTNYPTPPSPGDAAPELVNNLLDSESTTLT